ncbi:MAG: PqqD family protein [Candidatus Aminicenantia bacterium]
MSSSLNPKQENFETEHRKRPLLKKEKETKNSINLLDLVPVQNIKWEKQENGLIVLLKPKFKNPIFARYFLPRIKNPAYKIRLDKFGSYVWELCNGKNTVKDIGLKLTQKFGKEIEPVYDRLALFLKELERGKFIYYKNK